MNSFRESSPVSLRPRNLFGLGFVFGGKVSWFGVWDLGMFCCGLYLKNVNFQGEKMTTDINEGT